MLIINSQSAVVFSDVFLGKNSTALEQFKTIVYEIFCICISFVVFAHVSLASSVDIYYIINVAVCLM